MPNSNLQPVVAIIAEKPRTIRLMAKIVKKVLPRADVRTIYSVFTSVGEESMEQEAAHLARFAPDVIVCVVERRVRDCDLITTRLQRRTRKPLISVPASNRGLCAERRKRKDPLTFYSECRIILVVAGRVLAWSPASGGSKTLRPQDAAAAGAADIRYQNNSTRASA